MSTSSTTERFIFRIGQHSTNICSKLLSFYQNNEFFDTVVIANGNVKIHANKNVLSAMSEYFLEKYREGLKVNQVRLKEIDGTTLKIIIDFMYSGCIELTLTNSESILRAALFLKIKTLIAGCCEFIEKNINTSNCLKWLFFSKEQRLQAFHNISLKYTYDHFEEVSKQIELLLLNELQLRDLLFNDFPHGNRDFEEHAFLAMVAWIQHDKANREKHTFTLLQCVRYKSLARKFIVENCIPVCNTAECSHLVFKWLKWHESLEAQSIEIKKEAEEQEQEQQQEQSSSSKRRKEDAKLAVVMSFFSNSKPAILFQTFNTKTISWSIQKPTALRKMKTDFSMIVIDDKLIIVGGKINGLATTSVECLDLHTFEWSELPPMKQTRSWIRLVDFNGQLGVFSGLGFTDSLEIYSFLERKWMLSHSFPFSIRHIFHYKEKILIFDAIGRLHSCDPSSDKWSLTELGTGGILLPMGCGFALFGDFLFIFGGRNKEVYMNSAKRYNISENTWYKMAPLPRARSNVKTIVFEGCILIFGGGPNATWVDKYNPSTDTWMILSSLAYALPEISSAICTLPSGF